MKVVILGAGRVGGSLAEHLVNEPSADITIVDNNRGRLAELEERLDIRTVTGYASLPNVLEEAEVDDADMLIAVTGSDEVNIVACQVAWTLFHTPRKVARLRSTAYTNTAPPLFEDESMPIDLLINPEQLVTQQFTQLLHHPGALQVLDFADGLVQLVAIRADDTGPFVGCMVQDLRDHLAERAHIAAIFHESKGIVPGGSTTVEAGDEVYLIAAADKVDAVRRELQHDERPFKRIIIAGCGHIGQSLALAVENQFSSVKVLEADPRRAALASSRLLKAIVLRGDATDKDLLVDERIEDTDAFCAITNDDEVNIMSSLLVKQLGVRKVLTLIGKPTYIDLMPQGTIDVAISPQLATTSRILTYVRHGDIGRVHTLRRGGAEALEVVLHGGRHESKVVGRPLGELSLPKGTSICAVVRNSNVLMPRADLQLEDQDHVIVLIINKKHLADVEKMFQVGLNYY